MQGLPAGGSRTAILTAVARALHREEAPPWVLDDHLAVELAGAEGAEVRDRLVAEMPADSLLAFTRWVAVRARYAEDEATRAALERRATQYVVLGAGLDTFAYRRQDLTDLVAVFEVDHPATHTFKRERLDACGVDIPPNVVFAPVDFERETLRDGLLAAGFDFEQPAVVSWLGVSMYLSLDAIEATLEAVAACAPTTRFVSTYNLPPEALSGLGGKTEAIMKNLVADMGEPLVSLFRPHEIEALLGRHGYCDIDHFGPAEAVETYFTGRSDVRLGGAQRIVAATVP